MPFKFRIGVKRAGFTLAELVVATLIFGFMVASLATIYSTANKHMFQNYRMNTFKSSASVAMKAITTRLQAANRIDAPGPNASGSNLAFAVNVDQNGCYPVNSGEVSSWHYFCRSGVIPGECPQGNCLYYHTGTIAGGAGCPGGAAWAASYPVPSCGCAGCGTVTQLVSSVYPGATPPLFSRLNGDVNMALNLVKIRLRIYWDPATNFTAGRDFRTTAKIIDTPLQTTVKMSRAGR